MKSKGASFADAPHVPVERWARPIPDAGDDFISKIWNIERGCLQPEFKVFRLPIQFDGSAVATTFQSLVPEEKWSSKYGDKGWEAVSLTASNPDDPYGDEAADVSEYASNGDVLKLHVNAERPHTTPVYDSLQGVWDQLSGLKILKPRLSRLRTHHISRTHADGSGCVSIHLPLITNPGAGIILEGAFYHFPVDGHLYAINSERQHHLFNFGNDVRTHIFFHSRPNGFLIEPSKPSNQSAHTAVEMESKVIIELRTDVLTKGEDLYRRVRNACDQNPTPEFELLVHQESFDSGAFSFVLAGIIGVLSSYQRTFQFRIESATGRLIVPLHSLGAIEYLRKIPSTLRMKYGSPRALRFAENIEWFLGSLDFYTGSK